MTDQLLVALIAGAFLLVNTVIGVTLPFLFKRINVVTSEVASMKEDVSETKEQVVNNHHDKPNMRDQLDTQDEVNESRHAETLRLFGDVIKKQDQHEDIMVLLVNGYVGNREDIDRHEKEIDDLEVTLNPRSNNE
jgi:hypothetical protein